MLDRDLFCGAAPENLEMCRVARMTRSWTVGVVRVPVPAAPPEKSPEPPNSVVCELVIYEQRER